METESNIEKFELMKFIYSLDRTSKINIIRGWEELLKKASSENTIEEFKKEAKLHDPETADHIISIMDLLEKFLKVDDDISFGNICLFIQPMMMGSKKITLRPYRVIGLINRLHNLAKQFEKEYAKHQKVTPELRKIRLDFKKNLKEIKTRLMSLDNEIITKKRPEEPSPEFSSDIEVEKKIQVKVRKSSSEIATKLSAGSLAETVKKTAARLKNFSPDMAYRILCQTTYGYGEEFDEEIRKEIASRLR